MTDDEEKPTTFTMTNPKGEEEEHPLVQGAFDSMRMNPKGFKNRADINYANDVRNERIKRGGKNHD